MVFLLWNRDMEEVSVLQVETAHLPPALTLSEWQFGARAPWFRWVEGLLPGIRLWGWFTAVDTDRSGMINAQELGELSFHPLIYLPCLWIRRLSFWAEPGTVGEIRTQ